MALARLELSVAIATLARRWRMRDAPGFAHDPSPQTTSFPMRLAHR
jgi:hypothetical protein